MVSCESWALSDAFWEKVEPLIPAPRRDPRKAYKRKPGGGRKPIPSRKILEAIIYVLRTGCSWKALPIERFGSPSSIHTHFKIWTRAGFFMGLWEAGLAEYDEMEGIAWRWRSIPSFAGKLVDRNRTDTEKEEPKESYHGQRQWCPAVKSRNRANGICH